MIHRSINHVGKEITRQRRETIPMQQLNGGISENGTKLQRKFLKQEGDTLPPSVAPPLYKTNILILSKFYDRVILSSSDMFDNYSSLEHFPSSKNCAPSVHVCFNIVIHNFR